VDVSWTTHSPAAMGHSSLSATLVSVWDRVWSMAHADSEKTFKELACIILVAIKVIDFYVCIRDSRRCDVDPCPQNRSDIPIPNPFIRYNDYSKTL
jgi:hypothetical protein